VASRVAMMIKCRSIVILLLGDDRAISLWL